MKKLTVARDDRYYLAWPDVCLCADGSLLAVFCRTTHHGDRTGSRIIMTRSRDRGESWSPMKVFAGEGDDRIENGYFNCPRITALRDGRLAVNCDRIRGRESDRDAENFIWFSDDGGETWNGPVRTGLNGIVPDRLLDLGGRLLLAAHGTGRGGFLEQYLWYSDDGAKTWSDRVTVAAENGLNLCEASLLPMGGNTITAFLRENSGRGLDCLKTVSRDGGMTWGPVTALPLPGCHRPVSGFLKDGKILITYRFMQGGNGWLGSWTQNFFAALTDADSALSDKRENCRTRILPVDFDRSPVSDLGYSGWVQFPDGEIFVIYYIVDDAPKGQIRCARLTEKDFLLG